MMVMVIEILSSRFSLTRVRLRDEFDGVLLVVSHDRAFMDAVSEHLFVFEGDGQVRNFEGSFSDFLEFDKERRKAASGSKTLERDSKPEAVAVKPAERLLTDKPSSKKADAPVKKAVKMSYKVSRG